MSGPVFVAADVLVRADDVSDADKNRRAHEWLQALWARRLGRVSTQVLNDYYVAVTRQLAPGLSQGDARAKVRRYQLWQPWQIDHQTVETAWGIEARFGVSYADALLAACAQQSGCLHLLTEALPHQQQLGAVTILHPHAVQPEALLSAHD
jgi:predicted nucleic acid-binding protein